MISEDWRLILAENCGWNLENTHDDIKIHKTP